MTKQEAAIQYITENYLHFNTLRHDVVSDKLQIRMEKPTPNPSLKGGEYGAEQKSFPLGEDLGEATVWREMTKHDINSIVCHCAQEYNANITSREVMTALQSDLIPDVHPLREYILSLRPYTPDQPDWIDLVAQQVSVRDDIESYRMVQDGVESSSPEKNNPTQTYTTLHNPKQRLWCMCFKKWFVAMVAS